MRTLIQPTDRGRSADRPREAAPAQGLGSPGRPPLPPELLLGGALVLLRPDGAFLREADEAAQHYGHKLLHHSAARRCRHGNEAAMPSFPRRGARRQTAVRAFGGEKKKTAAEETWEGRRKKKRKKNPLACSEGGGVRESDER